MTGNAQLLFQRRVVAHVGVDGGIRNIFDQARTEHRCGNSENDVFDLHHLRKGWLRHAASWCVVASGNGEQIVDAAVWNSAYRSVGVHLVRESRLHHRPIDGEERRHGIGGTVICSGGELRVDTWTASPDGGLCMATAATVQIESWTQSSARFAGRATFYGIDFGEASQTILKELELLWG